MSAPVTLESPRGRFFSADVARLGGIELLRSMMEHRIPDPPLTRLTDLRVTEVGLGAATMAMPAMPWWQSAARGVFLGVLRGRPVGAVITGPLAEPEAGLAVAEHTLGPRHLVLRVANVGLRLAVGAARLTVLAPAVAFRGTRSDPNNSSLVLRAEVRGRRILLPGDAEIDAQEDLVRSDADPAELADDERRLRELEQWAAAATATGALSAMVEHPEATQHALAVLQETKSRQQLAELEAWARSQPPRQPEDPTPRQRTQWEQRNAYGTALAAWMANATSCEHRSCLPGACVYR